MILSRLAHPAVLFSAIVFLASCSGGSDSPPPPSDQPPLSGSEALEAQMREFLDALDTDADFTLMVEANNGRRFSHSTGNSSPTSIYRSASTSKWVTAAVILDLVQNGFLTLESKPQEYIMTWPGTGNRSEIQLHDLLTFTSGLNDEPLCINNPFQTLAECVDNIADENSDAPSPGTQFYYNSNHMHVAGLMAIRAAGVATWQEVFDNFKANTGLFDDAVYNLPSAQNPRLAGGMHWTAEEYLAFLEALYRQNILTPELIDSMTSDQIQTAEIVDTPTTAIGEDWHYGYGNWIECNSSVFNCSETTKVSSPGAYGAYPFIDFSEQYFGILAREGNLGTFAEGYDAFWSIESLLQEWAELNR